MIRINDRREREYISILVSRSAVDTNIGNIISEALLPGRGIIISKSRSEIYLAAASVEECEVFAADLSQFISLIEYLRESKMIFTHIDSAKMEKERSDDVIFADELTEQIRADIDGGLDPATSKLCYSVVSTDICRYIIDYIYTFVFVRSELADLVNRDFKSYEQEQMDRQYANMEEQLEQSRLQSFYARRTVRWSILAVVMSIVVPLVLKTLGF